MYKRESEADGSIAELQAARTPVLREAACWMIALAYVGTASNESLQRLLHIAISDVNGDVRRAAVIAIGFVLSKSPKETPKMIDLLACSHNASVRQGAALALGFACAGTGQKEAIDLLKPLLKDIDRFVRQAALIGMSLVLQQQSDEAVPYCAEFRKALRDQLAREQKSEGKHCDEVGLYGLASAIGLLYASGRNTVVSLNHLDGENSALATVALALYSNSFFWHPLALTLTLAFQPTCVIAVDGQLELPAWEFLCSASPKLFADPPTWDSETPKVAMAKKRALTVVKAEGGKTSEAKAEPAASPIISPPESGPEDDPGLVAGIAEMEDALIAAGMDPMIMRDALRQRADKDAANAEGEKAEAGKAEPNGGADAKVEPANDAKVAAPPAGAVAQPPAGEKGAAKAPVVEGKPPEPQLQPGTHEDDFSVLPNCSRVTYSQLSSVGFEYDFNWRAVAPSIRRGVIVLAHGPDA